MFENNDLAVDDIGQGELIKHAHPMLSLPTWFLDVNSITSRELAMAGVLESNTEFIDVSYKIDGVPGSCILGPNGWVRSVSRGKRFEGFVMNSAFLKVLPKPLFMPGNEVDIRGEFCISYSDFEEFNANLPEQERYANPRSMVSAQINAKQPDMNIMSCMKWLAHGLWLGEQVNEHFKALEQIIPAEYIAPHYNYDKATFFANSAELLSIVYDEAMHYEIPCDGIVIQYRATDENNGKCNLDRIAIKQFDEGKFSGVTKVKLHKHTEMHTMQASLCLMTMHMMLCSKIMTLQLMILAKAN
jgi:NAD-dependent DNA ligase